MNHIIGLLKKDYSPCKANKLMLDVFFQAHEKFMLELCKILRLDYVTATEQDILKAVRTLKNHTLPEFSGGLAIEQDEE